MTRVSDNIAFDGLVAMLASHHSIGWDFDGTLYGHRCSPLMHAYIRRNPLKKHFIVTFRTHGMQWEVFTELRAAYGRRAPAADEFSGVLNIEDTAYEELGNIRRRKLIIPGQRPSDVHPAETYWMEWKGGICAKHGITVLLDDMTSDVIDGCEKHGIVYINPDHICV